MEGESPTQAKAPGGAVFLSYASEDAEAAQRICEALRSATIEVWFDRSELRGGDAWDQSIRRQIKNCALFIPVVSRHTHDRAEGYFRLEWKLAVDRSHQIMANRAFLLPVVIDDTGDDDENVPDKFGEVQWTRLPAGETPPAFVERVQRLLSGDTSTATRAGAASGAVSVIGGRASASDWSKRGLALAAAAVILAGSYLGIEKPWISKSPAASATFAPPPHSIAVLPFVNLSGDKEQEYFSDGLTEELLNSLTAIDGLQVAARTSSFLFKQHPDIATVAHKLNVGAVLEGSVRRSSHTVRITAQLINSVTGFHMWSKTYDRDLGDVLKLQTEIATAVASALKVTLLSDVAVKVELGGTRNPDAFDAYLRGAKVFGSSPIAIAAYTEAIRLDPRYALAFAGRSIALSGNAQEAATAAAALQDFDRAYADARQALALAPDLPQAHLALAIVSEGRLDFAQASASYERALALAPGNAQILRDSGSFAAAMGRFDAGLAAARRATVLDPLAGASHYMLGATLHSARRYEEAVGAFAHAISLEPAFEPTYGYRGLAYYGMGDLQRARTSCETRPDYWFSQQCLAVIYDKLGRHTDAEAELAKLRATQRDGGAYDYAAIYAQWGNVPKALGWLETALRLRDTGLENLKTDPLLDPLRKEPRFQEIERQLKFPN